MVGGLVGWCAPLPPHLDRRGLRKPRPERAPFTEDTAYAPNSPYAASKAAADHLVRAYHHTYGLPVTTTNCSNNYGPYQFPEKLIPLMIVNALDGQAAARLWRRPAVRDWLYVRDHCRGIERVLEKGRLGETYNLGGNSERKNLDVVKGICQHMNKIFAADEKIREQFPEVPGRDRRRYGGADHLREGSPRPRPALRDRRDEGDARDRLRPGGIVRDGPAQDRQMVHRQRAVVARGDGWQLPRLGRAALLGNAERPRLGAASLRPGCASG